MNPTVVSLICLILGFLVCTFLPENGYIRNHLMGGSFDRDDNTRFILFQRILGTFFFGFIPFMSILVTGNKLTDYGLNTMNPVFSIFSGLSIGAILILINFLNRRDVLNLSMYPVIRKKEWTLSLVYLSALSWLIYLFSYEFLFRGYLLFSMVQEFGIWNGVAVNVVLYSLVHVPKGWKEAAGALPLGFVLCIVCLHAGNIWPAFIAHTCLALSNEWFALAIHPTLYLIKRRRPSQ
jgi:uncharacterized protein